MPSGKQLVLANVESQFCMLVENCFLRATSILKIIDTVAVLYCRKQAGFQTYMAKTPVSTRDAPTHTLARNPQTQSWPLSSCGCGRRSRESHESLVGCSEELEESRGSFSPGVACAEVSPWPWPSPADKESDDCRHGGSGAKRTLLSDAVP